MIKKNYVGNFTLTIDKNNISEANVEMLKELPSFITNGLTIAEAHIQTIKDVLSYYGFLIIVSGHEYNFKDFANMIKDYYELEGKNKWYYEYLMAI